MENPLLTIRKEKKFTLPDLCLLSGVSDTTAMRVERGLSKNVPLKILDTIERLGYSRQKFEADYAEWRKFRVQELEKNV